MTASCIQPQWCYTSTEALLRGEVLRRPRLNATEDGLEAGSQRPSRVATGSIRVRANIRDSVAWHAIEVDCRHVRRRARAAQRTARGRKHVDRRCSVE